MRKLGLSFSVGVLGVKALFCWGWERVGVPKRLEGPEFEAELLNRGAFEEEGSQVLMSCTEAVGGASSSYIVERDLTSTVLHTSR